MKNRITLSVTAIATVLAGLSTTAPALADTGNAKGAVEYVWEVDMRGKPPYKRERVPVETVDIASMEITDRDVATEVVWTREFTGRPPFKRERAELPVVDAASMEFVEDEESTTDFRGRPPFKRHR